MMRRLTVSGLAALAASAMILLPTQGAIAADSTFIVDAPATAELLWVDIELPGISLSDVTVSYRMVGTSRNWTSIKVYESEFGATGILPAIAGRYEFLASTDAQVASDLVVKFSTIDGAVVATQREHLAAAGAGTDDSADVAAAGPGLSAVSAVGPLSGSLAQTGFDAVGWSIIAAAALVSGGLVVQSRRRAIALTTSYINTYASTYSATFVSTDTAAVSLTTATAPTTATTTTTANKARR